LTSGNQRRGPHRSQTIAMLKASFVCMMAGLAMCVTAHPGNGIVALSAKSVVTGDALHNGVWKFEVGKAPVKLVERFHCHWVTKGLDGRLYAETLHETGGAWKSSVHLLKADGRYDKAVASTVDAIHGIFLIDRNGALVHQEKDRLVSDLGGQIRAFRGHGRPENPQPGLETVRALAWGPNGMLFAAQGTDILKAGKDGVLRRHATIEGPLTDRLYADKNGSPAIWSLAVAGDGSLYAVVPAMGRVVRMTSGRQTVIATDKGGWATTGVAVYGSTVFLLQSRTVGNRNEGPRVRSIDEKGRVVDLGRVPE